MHVRHACRNFAQYACRIKRVGHREEVVQDTLGMQDDVQRLLQLFYQRNNGVRPEAIVIYRDGVSHGEFKEVRFSLVSPFLSVLSY
jgi:hypothetical protein